MRPFFLSVAVLTAVGATPVLAQTVHAPREDVVTGPAGLHSVEPYSRHASNLPGMHIRSIVAPALPQVNLGPNATAGDYLRVAHDALAANQTGRAQSALENAETLLLNRAAAADPTNPPGQDPAVQNISSALRALGSHDIQTAQQLVQQTVQTAQLN